ncbi:hypothetical protein FQN51_000706 [Onygenales sp. PD_10]|nr:hypothetical protein FQN51_000706 [Onygenales sp. PD_10]
MAHNQPAAGGEYDSQTGVICNELCYGCSTERFAVALRGSICILTMGVSEILRGQDGWCAPCLQHPTVPPPHRTRSQVAYVTQQPGQRPPMGQIIPMTTTTAMQPVPAQGGVPRHPGRTPSHGYISPPPDLVHSTYARSQPNTQLKFQPRAQQQVYSEFQQQPLPQIQPEALSSQAYPGYEEQVPHHVPEQMYEYEQQQQMDLEQQNQQQAYAELQPQTHVQQHQQQQQWQQQYPQQPPHRINSLSTSTPFH